MIFSPKEETLFKTICKVAGYTPAPLRMYKSFSEAMSDLYNNGYINLPTDDSGRLICRAAVEVTTPIVDFVNFSILTNDNRFVVKKKGAKNSNKLIEALDSFPNVIQIVSDKAYPPGYKNCFIAMKSTSPELKQYIDIENICGGIVMSTVIPNDFQFDGQTTVMQLISLKLFLTNTNMVIRD